MPVISLKTPKFTPPREAVIAWNTWKKGLNTILRPTEIDATEMQYSTNLILVGSGAPTKRWGSQNYYKAGATGSTRYVFPIKDSDESQQVISLTDWGYLTKKSGSSYAMLTGASWASGSDVEATQLGGNVYLTSSLRAMVRYDFSSLTAFATIATPQGAAVSNISAATGTNTVSWRVTAISKSGGETLASTPVSLASLPQDLTQTIIRVAWSPVSTATGDLSGYNIYRGSLGNELWVGGVDDTTTQFFDIGQSTSGSTRVVPVTDTTGGPLAKYIIRYQDRLILAGIPGEPTKVLISGRFPDQERFDWFAGGGFVYIEPDSGESITGLGIYQEKLVIFKENSVWQLTLNQVQYGQYLILDPQYKLLTASQGCSSHRSIVPVENDLMFANEKGIYILRYEPQLLTILNANEISAKIRPYFEALSYDDATNCAGAYIDKKYVLSFPSSKESIVFDRERLSFMGPWTTPFGISKWAKYIDSDGMERWVAADADDNYVTEFSKSYTDDKNTAIRTFFKTKKEDFHDWSAFKTINEVYMLFRSVKGSVSANIYLEERDGSVTVAKTFTITATGSEGTSGFGTDPFGLAEFGLTNNTADPAEDEIPKKSFIYKTARSFQVEIRTTGKTDNYELLGILTTGIVQPRGNSPSAWIVS